MTNVKKVSFTKKLNWNQNFWPDQGSEELSKPCFRSSTTSPRATPTRERSPTTIQQLLDRFSDIIDKFFSRRAWCCDDRSNSQKTPNLYCKEDEKSLRMSFIFLSHSPPNIRVRTVLQQHREIFQTQKHKHWTAAFSALKIVIKYYPIFLLLRFSCELWLFYLSLFCF